MSVFYSESQNYSGSYCKALYIRACGYSTPINAQPIKQTPQTQEGTVSIRPHQKRHHSQTTTRFLKVPLHRIQNSSAEEMLTAQDSNRPPGRDEVQGQALTRRAASKAAGVQTRARRFRSTQRSKDQPGRQ